MPCTPSLMLRYWNSRYWNSRRAKISTNHQDVLIFADAALRKNFSGKIVSCYHKKHRLREHIRAFWFSFPIK